MFRILVPFFIMLTFHDNSGIFVHSLYRRKTDLHSQMLERSNLLLMLRDTRWPVFVSVPWTVLRILQVGSIPVLIRCVDSKELSTFISYYISSSKIC